MTNSEEKSEISLRRTAKLLNCGFISGLIQAFVFNPWDRALYLSVTHERPFLTAANFAEPMKGVTQTVVQRAISAGLYFPLEEIFSEILLASGENDETTKAWKLFAAGTVAGSLNGVVMNPFTRIKYHFWGKTHQNGGIEFFRIAKEIYSQGGIRHFFLGSNATVQRDLIFGGIFALFRHQVIPAVFPSLDTRKETKRVHFVVNILAGSIATILSSPHNYVRNVHYATPPSQTPLPAYTILQSLVKDAIKQDSWFKSIRLLQNRLRLGWGTARVGCGMAFGAKIYEVLANEL